MQSTAYRVIGLIGKGAMGQVYEVEHKVLKKRRVAKVLHAQLHDPAYFERMRLEGQALAELSASSPHLVAVLDAGLTATGSPFLIMERLEGVTLGKEIRVRSGFPPHEAVDITLQILAGLGVVHAAGVVHRDIKPDNLFLCTPVAGRRLLKILDFGVAKVLEGAGPAITPITVPTADGTIIGSPLWLSPEQVRSRPVDRRSDLYAVGLVLYTLLAGRNPFEGADNIVDLFRAHAERMPPPPSQVGTQPIPTALDVVVLKAIAKDPADRYQDAAAFALELSRALQGSSDWHSTEPMKAIRVAPSAAPEPEPADAPIAERASWVPPAARAPSDREMAPTEPVGAATRATGAQAQVSLRAAVLLAAGVVMMSVALVLVLRWLLGV